MVSSLRATTTASTYGSITPTAHARHAPNEDAVHDETPIAIVTSSNDLQHEAMFQGNNAGGGGGSRARIVATSVAAVTVVLLLLVFGLNHDTTVTTSNSDSVVAAAVVPQDHHHFLTTHNSQFVALEQQPRSGSRESAMGGTKTKIHHQKNDDDSNNQDDDSGVPSLARRVFRNQRVNHFDDDDLRRWDHQYFVYDVHWRGPGEGRPIIVKLGGESPAYGHLYPYITKHMAAELGAYVVQTEHRFYGKSEPLGNHPSLYGLEKLFTPEQALADYHRIIRLVQHDLGCEFLDKTSPLYCPVIVVGGSYPGCLAAIFRMAFPDVVDIAYASSAPMILNAHKPGVPDPNALYEHISGVAERAWPGCAHGVQTTLKEVYERITVGSSANTKHKDNQNYERVALELGVCLSRIPKYMQSDKIFAQELTQLVVNIHGDMSMDNYPPSDDTMLVQSCKIFADPNSDAMERYSNFLRLVMDSDDYADADPWSYSCFDMWTQIPSGPNATLSCADWTGKRKAEITHWGTHYEMEQWNVYD
jgi:Serine carboxypeptidase S28